MAVSKTARTLTLILLMLGALTPSGITAQQLGMALTVDLAEYDDSGISGTALLIETTEGGTHVSMELGGETLDGNHPTHIHTGTCANFDPAPLYPLETVNLSPVSREGLSDTDIPGVSLASLREGEFVILVHRSPELLTEYLICGEIGIGTVGQAEKVKPAEGAAMAHHMPTAGSGVNSSRFTDARFLGAASGALLFTVAAAVIRKGIRSPN